LFASARHRGTSADGFRSSKVKAFQCQHCGQSLYFENQLCDSCGRRLGYLASIRQLSALEPAGTDADVWRALAAPDATYRFCLNAIHGSCNWLVKAGPTEEAYCAACRHNRIIPYLTALGALGRWRRIQTAQHRLFDALLALKLPLTTRAEHDQGLAFDILYDPFEGAPQGPAVTTGHMGGLITLNLAEADDPARERLRQTLGEPYRTLLGHFRHEIGHYYWDRLVRDGSMLEPFRALFGDERRCYDDALANHYAIGRPPLDWRNRYISAYAAVHPWEDFAETWAHYLHMVDTLETAAAFGVRLAASRPAADAADLDPYETASLEQLISAWLPLTFTVNCLNRSMGQPDLYPFTIPPTVILKLAFVHDLIRGRGNPLALADRPAETLKALIAGLAASVGDPTAG
jgi:hypothetical protein